MIVPKGAALTGSLRPGDLLVSNINNANNVMGQGTTVELIRPSDAHPTPKTFFAGAASPIAMELNANATSLWIANFGVDQYGFTGNVDVVTNKGMLFAYGRINDPRLQGSWGQGFNGQPLGGEVPPVFLDTNTLTGAVYRLQHFALTLQGPHFAGATITQIAALGHSGTTINDVQGPQGMAWPKMNDTLFIADTVNNRIVAVQTRPRRREAFTRIPGDAAEAACRVRVEPDQRRPAGGEPRRQQVAGDCTKRGRR